MLTQDEQQTILKMAKQLVAEYGKALRAKERAKREASPIAAVFKGYKTSWDKLRDYLKEVG